MTLAGRVDKHTGTWRDVLPAARRYVALPSSARPVIVTEDRAELLRYTRTALLARPPASRVPGSAYEAARQVLRFGPAWRAAPRLRSESVPDRSWQAQLADWIATDDYHVIVLDHSNDPNGSAVLLLFPQGSETPTVAIKVPSSPAANERVAGEHDRLAALSQVDLPALAGTVPRIVPLPAGLDRHVLATTAQPGTSMFVTYHRGGHSRRPDRVGADFVAADRWLATLQDGSTGEPAPLDIAASTLDAAVEQVPADDERPAVLDGLAALRRRLRAHRAAQCVVHGDFWAGNVLVDGSRITGVVDWERWEPSGSPIRDVGRFAVAYSTYLDRHTRPGRRVRGHSFVAGSPSGAVGYAIVGDGWYPTLVRDFVATSLRRAGLPTTLVTDVLLSELAATAAEATEPDFAAGLWSQFGRLCERLR